MKDKNKQDQQQQQHDSFVYTDGINEFDDDDLKQFSGDCCGEKENKAYEYSATESKHLGDNYHLYKPSLALPFS